MELCFQLEKSDLFSCRGKTAATKTTERSCQGGFLKNGLADISHKWAEQH